jgi:formylglycine-generating enzyme
LQFPFFSVCLYGQNKPIIEWIDIPAGTFTMGSPVNELNRTGGETQHQVTLSAFKMSKYEITFDQYDAFCDITKHKKPDDSGWGRGKRPVINVSKEDAEAFCKWMGCRLPTEAEWEYACRAGTTTTFNTGDNLTTSQANYNGNFPYGNNPKGEFRGKTLPVGSFAPNAWGLYDMHGNVLESVSDLWEEFTSDPQTDPKGATANNIRIWRGGSWQFDARLCRSAIRTMVGYVPNWANNYMGFRVASGKIPGNNNPSEISTSKTVTKSETTTGKRGVTSTSTTTTSSTTKISFGKTKIATGTEPNTASTASTTSTVSTSTAVLTVPGTISDIDGNIYHLDTIGRQIWLVENLKTTKYNDGSPIPLIKDGHAWSRLTTAGYCFYNNDVTFNKATYGAIYNWYTVNTNKLCPNGWHVPSDAEWKTLTNYLGGEDAAGGKLKETGISHWSTPNDGATNSSGFTALPGGYRQEDGSFYNINDDNTWWSSTLNNNNAFGRNVNYNYSYVTNTSYNKNFGFSVRCLRD